MKKLLILLLLFIFSMFSFKIVSLAIPQTIDYEVSYYEGFKYDLNDGVLKTDAGYISTSLLPLFNYSTGFVNDNFHHVLFWDSGGNYLGYYNTDKTSFENEFYLDTLNPYNVNIIPPLNASRMAFMISLGVESVYNTFNKTLEELFSDISTTPILTNLIVNGDFNDLDNDNVPDGWVTVSEYSTTFDTRYATWSNGILYDSTYTGQVFEKNTPNPYANNSTYISISRQARSSGSSNNAYVYINFQKGDITGVPFTGWTTYINIFTGTNTSSGVPKVVIPDNFRVDFVAVYDIKPLYDLGYINDLTINDFTNFVTSMGYDINTYIESIESNDFEDLAIEYNVSIPVMEYYYDMYLMFIDDYPIQISKEEFIQIQPFYIYIVEAPEEVINFSTILDNLFNIQGFSGSFVKMIISAIIIGGAVFMLAMYKAGGLLILGVAGIIYTGLAIIGWLPQAPILIMGLGLLALIILKFVKGGGGSDEE